MTRDEIIKLAREAGWGNVVSMPHIQALERFAALVADAEREIEPTPAALLQRYAQLGGGK